MFDIIKSRVGKMRKQKSVITQRLTRPVKKKAVASWELLRTALFYCNDALQQHSHCHFKILKASIGGQTKQGEHYVNNINDGITVCDGVTSIRYQP